MLVDTAELTDENLASMAEAADAGEPAEASVSAQTPEEPRESSTINPNSSEATTAATQAGAKEQKEPDHNSSDTRAEDNADTSEDKTADSRFARAIKERERRERSWRTLEQEKQAFRSEREAFEAERQSFLAERQQQEQPQPRPAKDEHGYSAEDYEQYAKEQVDAGNHAMAQRARARAEALRARQQDVGTAQQVPSGLSPVTAEAWSQQVQQVADHVPELHDETHPLAREVASLVNAEPIFSHDPQGFAKAVTVARWKLDAARVPELLKQVETHKSEIEKLNRALSIGGSNALRPSHPRTYDGMSEAEKDDFMARQAAEADHIA